MTYRFKYVELIFSVGAFHGNVAHKNIEIRNFSIGKMISGEVMMISISFILADAIKRMLKGAYEWFGLLAIYRISYR